MDIKEHTTPEKLLHYSFLWSLLSILFTAFTLFLGASPVIFKIIPSSFSSLFSLVSSLLAASWIISGLAAGYLLYRWNTGGKMVFGGKKRHDLVAFFILVVTGLNLGFAGLFGSNIALSIITSSLLLKLGGVMYLVIVGYLFNRWSESGKKLF